MSSVSFLSSHRAERRRDLTVTPQVDAAATPATRVDAAAETAPATEPRRRSPSIEDRASLRARGRAEEMLVRLVRAGEGQARPQRTAEDAATSERRAYSVGMTAAFAGVNRPNRSGDHSAQRAGDSPSQATEPSVPSDSPGATIRVEGRAFPTGILGIPHVGPEDVDQGGVGDCAMMASMAALAHTDPEAITGRVTDNEDGTFTVRLGDDELTVTPEFPEEGAAADATPGTRHDVLWPALVEKAFAQDNGNSYDNLEGFSAVTTLEALTGESVSELPITESTDVETLWEEIQDGIEDDHAMVLESRDDLDETLYPLHGNHDYAVLGAREIAGRRYVELYNPHGINDGDRSLQRIRSDRIDPEQGRNERTTFLVPLDDLGSCFDRLLTSDY